MFKFIKNFLLGFILSIFLYGNVGYCADSSDLTVSGSNQVTMAQSFSNTYKEFYKYVKSSENSIINASKQLFFALALISLVWNLSQSMLKGTEINSLLFDLVKFTMTVGFFWWLIEGVSTIINPLFEKFGKFGGDTFGVHASSIADIIQFGCDTAVDILTLKGQDGSLSIFKFNIFSIVLAVFQVLIALAVLIVSFVMAMNLAVAMVDFMLTAYLGLFVLGLAGSSWTRESSMTYLKNLLSKCVKYYATMAVMIVCFNVMNSVLKGMAGKEYGFGNICVILMVFLIVTKVIEVVPQSISSMIGNAGNTDVASASGIAKAGAMMAGAMAGGVAMKVAGRVGGNLAGMAGSLASKGAGLAGKGLGIASSAIADSKVGQAIGNSTAGKVGKAVGKSAGYLGNLGGAVAKGVFGKGTSADEKLKNIGHAFMGKK